MHNYASELPCSEVSSLGATFRDHRNTFLILSWAMPCTPLLAVCVHAQVPTGTIIGIAAIREEHPYPALMFRQLTSPAARLTSTRTML
jgi:hypothetical protein